MKNILLILGVIVSVAQAAEDPNKLTLPMSPTTSPSFSEYCESHFKRDETPTVKEYLDSEALSSSSPEVEYLELYESYTESEDSVLEKAQSSLNSIISRINDIRLQNKPQERMRNQFSRELTILSQDPEHLQDIIDSGADVDQIVGCIVSEAIANGESIFINKPNGKSRKEKPQHTRKNFSDFCKALLSEIYKQDHSKS